MTEAIHVQDDPDVGQTFEISLLSWAWLKRIFVRLDHSKTY